MFRRKATTLDRSGDLAVRRGARTLVLGAAAAALMAVSALAADIPAASVKLAPGVTRAKAYESVDQKFIVTNPTDIFANYAYYETKKTGEMKRGDPVNALAMVKGWDWILVGNKDGVGIGYIPRSLVTPEKYWNGKESG